MKLLKLIGCFTLCLSACDKAEPQSAAAETYAPAVSKTEAKAAASKTDDKQASQAGEDPHAGLARYEVDHVATLLSKKEIVPVDANSVETRKEYGTLPGALLLSSSEGYDLAELPEDKAKNLVFYCGGQKCAAAPKAARRAEQAGYSNVHVMPDGIRGWVKAGKAVDQTS